RAAHGKRCRMESVDGGTIRGNEGDGHAIAIGRRLPVEGFHHPEAATHVAVRTVTDLARRVLLPPVADERQDGIVEAAGARQVVGADGGIEQHQASACVSASSCGWRPLKPFASRNISTDSAREAPGLMWMTC